jgi:hypothetical protein
MKGGASQHKYDRYLAFDNRAEPKALAEEIRRRILGAIGPRIAATKSQADWCLAVSSC